MWVKKGTFKILHNILQDSYFSSSSSQCYVRTYSNVPNKRAYTFISANVYLLGSIKVMRQTLQVINVYERLFGTLEYLGNTVVEFNWIQLLFWSEFCYLSLRIRCSSAFFTIRVKKLQVALSTFQVFFQKKQMNSTIRLCPISF